MVKGQQAEMFSNLESDLSSPALRSPQRRFDREQFAEKLKALARQNIFPGTSSWKYAGWCGMFYDPARYEYRGKFAETRFDRDCLREYAAHYGAQPRLWRYLTGPQKEVERTVVQGFHTAMAKLPIPGQDAHTEAFDIMHGERLVLVDPQGRIRGFYDADEPDAIIRDARLLTPGGRG